MLKRINCISCSVKFFLNGHKVCPSCNDIFIIKTTKTQVVPVDIIESFEEREDLE